jgi:hypothetical protein
MVFKDGSNNSFIGGIAGIRTNPNANFNGDIGFFTNSGSGSSTTFAQMSERMRITAAGNVGIGITPVSTSRLHLYSQNASTWLNLDRTNDNYEAGVIFSSANTGRFYLYSDNTDSGALKIQASDLSGEGDNTPRMEFPKVSKDIFMVESGGNVGIGTTSPDERLTVRGKIHTSEIRVDLEEEVVPDYVFEKEYDLMNLSEVETFINTNKHLPEVPSAREMEAEGMNLKEMNLILLKKVEELTLHLIDLKKENEKQDAQIRSLQKNEN